ncbi:MAG: methyltransferase domain-containing protein [Anaerolineae bacterium]|nr:methyltransferase domain-containing protein [Anaerolineae bacterium]
MQSQFNDIFICPHSRQTIRLDLENQRACAAGADVSYPIQDGIINFLPDVKDNISLSYDSLSTQYDAYMLSDNVLWKLINRITWGFDNDRLYADALLDCIPDDFDGVLLDVPSGTSVLTLQKYRRLKHATIIAVDYSMGMLLQAQKNYREHGIQNVLPVRADVGNLPIDDQKIDFCLSMNGFHIFPDKKKALSEISRVLKPAAHLAFCFYARGKRALTDFLVQNLLYRQGAFCAPYYNEDEILQLFGPGFEILSKGNVKSIFYLNGKKRQGVKNIKTEPSPV